jgi:NAD(P)-dependent dehydrogenase (short-subunit alcohol dehydrogenase family)
MLGSSTKGVVINVASEAGMAGSLGQARKRAVGLLRLVRFSTQMLRAHSTAAGLAHASLRLPAAQSAYSASKGAVYAMTRSWAKELGEHGIRVVGIAPGVLEATGLRTPDYEHALVRLLAAHAKNVLMYFLL